VTEVVVHGAGREQQVVVGHAAGGRVEAARGEIDAVHLGQHHARVRLVAQNGADRLRDVRGRERRARDLVEQRLKQVVVVAVDDQHVSGGALERAGGEQSAEAATDDHDPRPPRAVQRFLRKPWEVPTDLGTIIGRYKPP
jgi:hypothetical protein